MYIYIYICIHVYNICICIFIYIHVHIYPGMIRSVSQDPESHEFQEAFMISPTHSVANHECLDTFSHEPQGLCVWRVSI